jgi:hypothetical protein
MDEIQIAMTITNKPSIYASMKNGRIGRASQTIAPQQQIHIKSSSRNMIAPFLLLID